MTASDRGGRSLRVAVQADPPAMSSAKAPMSNQAQDPNDKKEYDLEDRTARFGEAIIELVKTLRHDPVNNPLISQVVRSGTSIGANYMEADGAGSRKDFRYRISICRKECKETKHWLRMIATASPALRDECQRLSREAHELSLIFSAILLPRKE